MIFDTVRLRKSINQIVAHIMEFALYIDDPVLILKAQRDLIKANFRLLRLIAVPSLLMAIPSVFLYSAIERHFAANRSNVLTLPMGRPLPPGVVAETPPVRILRTHEVSWRIRRKR